MKKVSTIAMKNSTHKTCPSNSPNTKLTLIPPTKIPIKIQILVKKYSTALRLFSRVQKGRKDSGDKKDIFP